jgi:hypothetical protein
MNRRALLTGLPLAALTGCAIPTAAPTDPTTATAFWGIVKGTAEQAATVLAIVDPPAGIALGAAVAGVDAIVTNLPAIEADATATATAVASIYTQSQAVLLTAAPHITVVPNKTT